MSASLGEAESSTSPRSERTRVMASTMPKVSGRPAAICARRGKRVRRKHGNPPWGSLHPRPSRGSLPSSDFLELTAGNQRGFDVEQCVRVQYTAPNSQLEGRADIVRSADGQVMGGEQQARLRGFRQQPDGFVEIGSGMERVWRGLPRRRNHRSPPSGRGSCRIPGLAGSCSP